jgi:hypothetical protein
MKDIFLRIIIIITFPIWALPSILWYISGETLKELKGKKRKEKMKKQVTKDYTRHAIWIIVGYLVLLSVYVLYFI